ncbi:MAG TPA: TonB-dependent receptor [Mucilaginibacter sp.]|nr:TonB-dependent receptor [Mucilaginibacter sp.]
MVKIYLLLFFVFGACTIGFAQKKADTLKRDSAKHLTEVTVRGYLIEQPVLSVPASVSVIGPAQLKLQPENSLVSALNTVPGVRMEERSPGSYRLSIRGSLLRSPFGVRDVKIYYDEIPLTDAGGNSYLNAIDVNSVQGIEVLKGPDGSLFGANSGGVVLISPVNRYNDSSYLSAGLNAGSYGLFHENIALQNVSAQNQLNISQAYQTYGGYRQHSYTDRHFVQASDKLTLSKNDQLKFLGLYSDLGYQTPGGLTLAQYQADPRSARLPTKVVPGAIQQKIGIYQKVLLGGLVNEVNISDRLRNVSSVFGSYVDFANPFITNYEQRYEGTYGLRSYFELSGKPDTIINWKVNVGLEWQQTNSDINNYGNRAGLRDTAQTLDKINTNQHFFFARYVTDIHRRLHIEAALSLNFYDYKFRNVYPNNEADFANRSFSPQLMPRLALSYQVTNNFIWRASVSRGYSTPTTAEIRPTDNVINTNLQAQYGWNYETGFRLRNADESMFLDASVFYYKLNNAIIPHQNANETQTYINAGGTNQPGIELYFTDWLIRQNEVSFIRGLQINESLTLDRFRFAGTNNQLTGVPNAVVVTSVQVKLPARLFVFVEHNYTSRIPLTDANTIFAGHYNLVQAKAGWEHVFRKNRLGIYAGVDNLLNEKYSLGNDLNAIGNRFYNPSAPRNYYVGLNMTL